MEKVGKQGIIRKQILPFSYSKMPWTSSPIDEAGRNHPGIVNREWDSYPQNLACQISQSPYLLQAAATGAKTLKGPRHAARWAQNTSFQMFLWVLNL